MRMAFVLCLLLIPPGASAQSFQWTQSGVTSLAQAASYVYRVYVNNEVPELLSRVVCTGVVPAVICQAPATVRSLVDGASSQLTAQDPVTRLESARSAPYVYHLPSPTPCVYAGTAYSVGSVLTATVTRKRLPVVTSGLEAAGFHLDAAVLLKGKYRITATCIG